MPQLIKPSEVRFVTKEGECQISLSLDININLNADDLAGISAKHLETVEKDDKPAWVVPDFGGKKVKFGKEVEE